jgi:hypothetical protein
MSSFHMADIMRWCIMHNNAVPHQVFPARANNCSMHEKTRDIIRSLMKANEIESERQLALACNMDQSTLHRFLAEKTDTLNFVHIQSLAQYFSITVSQLIGETPIEQDQKIRSVVLAMQKLPEYKKDVIVTASQALASSENHH